MNIPKYVKDLFVKIFTKTQEFEGPDYKGQILSMAIDDEERRDLEELFQSTAAYYAERKSLDQSGLSASEYLEQEYMVIWREQNPNASEEQKEAARKDLEEALSDAAENILNRFEEDGVIAKTNKYDDVDNDVAAREYYEAINPVNDKK